MTPQDNPNTDARNEDFEAHRPLMFSIAYRMLGSAMEAEDVVQDAYLRWRDAPAETVRSPKAYLSTVVTRLCLDQLKSAKTQREVYTGPWLPEPLLTAAAPAPMKPDSDEYDSLSMAVMVLLEALSPSERAVFVLRAVFDYDYTDIAQIVGKEEAACRQLFSRAQKHVAAHRPRYKPSPEKHAEILSQFLQAVALGDLNGLTTLLAEDVVWTSDGGGKVSAARRPIFGRDKVARFALGLSRMAPEGFQMDITEVNGDVGVILREADGKLMYVITFQVGESQIIAVRAISNPDKLKHIS